MSPKVYPYTENVNVINILLNILVIKKLHENMLSCRPTEKRTEIRGFITHVFVRNADTSFGHVTFSNTSIGCWYSTSNY